MIAACLLKLAALACSRLFGKLLVGFDCERQELLGFRC